MQYEAITKPAFFVIGRAGSTEDGEGFVEHLWAEANSRFGEVAPLAKTGPDGSLAGIWGAMTDFEYRFLPWENGFSAGRYLAGIEAEENAEPPAGWEKWHIPGFVYIRVLCDEADIFPRTIAMLQEQKQPLAGAVQDFTDPASGRNYMLFPIERMEGLPDWETAVI